MGCAFNALMAAFPKFVDLITVKVYDKDHSIGVTKGACQCGGSFRRCRQRNLSFF